MIEEKEGNLEVSQEAPLAAQTTIERSEEVSVKKVKQKVYDLKRNLKKKGELVLTRLEKAKIALQPPKFEVDPILALAEFKDLS